MKTISAIFLGLFFMLMLSSTAFADSAVGRVNVTGFQAPSGGGGGGHSWRNIIIYNINITNGSVVATPEQISLPLVKPIANETAGRKILFDIGVKINKKDVFVNEKLSSTISLINLGVPGKVNVTAIYRIIDSAGNTVYEESEIVPVETQLEFLKEFDISKLDEGTYTLLSEIKYEGQKEPARAADSFSIAPSKTTITGFAEFESLVQNNRVLIVIGIIAALVIVAAAIILNKTSAGAWLSNIYTRKLSRKVHIHFPSKSKKL
jgi:hypothetical protein